MLYRKKRKKIQMTGQKKKCKMFKHLNNKIINNNNKSINQYNNKIKTLIKNKKIWSNLKT